MCLLGTPKQYRLIRSANLVAVGLPLGYETWPAATAFLWLAALNIGYDWLRHKRIVHSRNRRIFSPFYTSQWQSPCTALTASKCLPLGLCKETAKESKQSGDFPSESPHFGELNIESGACSLTTSSLSRALPSMVKWPCPKPANATQMCKLFQACTLTSSFEAGRQIASHWLRVLVN